ncbi:hypothetical protein B0A56_00035 [Flavobacterium columnare NBRC 100251 = ATCC 23463]|nr:hypothetical protein B0A56_00035 [Flavobacterium columnare NBRC 100251 = ATCC 23463]
MKKVFSIVFLIACFNLFGQKQFEATDKKSGQATTILEGSRVKLTTQDRSQMLIKNAETLTIEGQEVALTNISSIKNYPHGGRKSKNGSAFALFAGGTGTIITGALFNNKHKTLIYRNYIFKIVE